MKFREKEKILRQIEEKSYEEELDENDYSILNKLSYDKEVFIRDLVAVILVESSDEKGEEILLRLTNDKEWLVRADACDSLCISESVTTYNLLKKIAKKDTSGYVRGYAILSLGDIADKINKEDELLEYLEDRLKHEKVQFTKIDIYAVLYNLGRKEYFDNLVSMLNSKKYLNRGSVVNILNYIANEDNRDMIIKVLLEHKKKETAMSVVYTINDVIKEIEEMDEDEESDE
ncbi:HEAT repeat domain-containing protein [Eubacterium sp. AF19-12LB]|uniref:HEAT repeat domain-containing protein n=1 Tax=Eubacterium sp. AF19-12LB TaxID=2293106 RepID=UPI000E549861|nr:HEAT repeat domain-containing protein [Eubacterium sp. AF19-12LB]RHR32279.1 HEAT repeat domain-containing protein [Eubacterium sp. AF19-12LB]